MKDATRTENATHVPYTDSQLEQLERDAERYRWLRSINTWPSANDHARAVKFDVDGALQFLTGEVLDRACDQGQIEDAARTRKK